MTQQRIVNFDIVLWAARAAPFPARCGRVVGRRALPSPASAPAQAGRPPAVRAESPCTVLPVYEPCRMGPPLPLGTCTYHFCSRRAWGRAVAERVGRPAQALVCVNTKKPTQKIADFRHGTAALGAEKRLVIDINHMCVLRCSHWLDKSHGVD